MVILQKKVAAMSRTALERFLLRARRAAGVRGRVNVLVTSSGALRSLNREFRGKDKTTDVLSFLPAPPRGPKVPRLPFAGDIAISADIAAQNALGLGHSPAAEVKILTLHGVLHLAGFDHERDNGTMARKEQKLRQMLKLPAALIERTQPAEGKSRKKSRSPREPRTT